MGVTKRDCWKGRNESTSQAEERCRVLGKVE